MRVSTMLLTGVVLVVLLAGQSSSIVVNTLYGPVDGNTIVLDGGKIVHSFWGIPFAAPPVGDLRFERPQPPMPWTATLPVKTLPNACMQDFLGLLLMTHPGWLKYDEDCLTLNIFTPENIAGGPYPVMVWFHGGAYLGGANIQYPGHFLAAKDVIVVVPNYRLGAFGFLATPDGTIKGNMGLWDQALALRFVRNNIASFGGNPNSVTIFGQSAGAGSSALHMVSPVSSGLYHRAILESGTENNLWSLNYPGQQPEQYVYQTAQKVNCTGATDPEIIACLRTKPAVVIRVNQDLVCTPGFFCQGYAPIIDGIGHFIPKHPLTMKEELSAASTVPIISGICKDDGSLYTQFFIPESNDGGFNRTEFEYYLHTRLFNFFAAQMTQQQYDDTFEATYQNYAPYPYLEDEEGNRQAFNKIITDAAFGYSWDRNLKTNSEKNVNTYAYVQAFRGLNASSFIPEWMGVPHMGELPYVWGYAHLLNNPDVRVDCGINFDVVGWTPEDITYADYQMTLWTNFAKFSNPTITPVRSPFNSTMTTWEKYSWNDQLKVMWLDTEISTKTDYEQRNYAFWREYMSYIVDRPTKSAGRKPVSNFNSQTVTDGIRRYVSGALAARGMEV